MASSPPSPPKTDIEPPVVSVFVRPLEVTVPVLDSPPLPKSQPPQKTVWSTMTSRIESETSVKRWATPQEKREEGQPPGPEDQPETRQGKKYEGNVKTITPSYKVGEPTHETKLGAFGTLPEGRGDYKMSMRQEDYKQTVIDPKVRSNANMPLHSTRLPDAKRTLADDFPSEHSKRSQIKLEPLEQRRFKSVERRPVTTSNYLTESVNRHRDADQSVLHRYLKAKEGDANKPWDKPNWPGAKKTNDDESLRELEHMKQKLETITRAAQQPPKTDDLDRLNRRTAELEERSRARRTDYRLIDSEILKTTPAPLPKETHETLESRTSEAHREDHDRSGYATDVSTATWQFSTHSFSPRSVVSMNGAREDILKRNQVQNQYSYDDKPRSIMKRRELESREQMMYPSNQQLVEHKTYQRSQSNVAKPTVTETVQRFEETRRTEEIERRVQRKERRERRSRHHSSSRHNSGAQWGSENYLTEQRRVASLPRRQIVYQQANRAMTNDEIDDVVREAYEAADDARRHGTRVRSNSLSRGLPSSQEAYYKQTTTRRERDQSGSRFEDEAFGGRGLAHARYGSLSDSLRRGELKYIPNGDVRENFQTSNGRNMHKSYSTRDVFSGGDHIDRRSLSSQRRGSQQQVSPFVEFPPTLPRRSERDNYRPISKSRSYADWDDAGRAGFGRQVQRYDDDMSRLEAEFRDSLLMPMPRGNMNERDHRTEQIPGGYETFDKNNRANSGRRLGRDGQPVDFHESSQEYNYKREQELDRRR